MCRTLWVSTPLQSDRKPYMPYVMVVELPIPFQEAETSSSHAIQHERGYIHTILKLLLKSIGVRTPMTYGKGCLLIQKPCVYGRFKVHPVSFKATYDEG